VGEKHLICGIRKYHGLFYRVAPYIGFCNFDEDVKNGKMLVRGHLRKSGRNMEYLSRKGVNLVGLAKEVREM
jgi:hypothetical protein